MNALQELLPLLSRGTLKGAAAARRIRAAADGDDFAWADDPSQALTLALCDALGDVLFEGDKLDELHEQLRDAFEDRLAPFPQKRYAAAQRSRFAYFEWLDEQLAARGLALVSIEPGIDDQIRVVLVDRTALDRIAELADELELTIDAEDGTVPDFLAGH